MSGCSQDGLVETISGSGSFVNADDGTVTEFEIDTSVVYTTDTITVIDPDTGEETEQEVDCTDLIQFGTATFTDCAADMEATVMLSVGDEMTIRECYDLIENDEDLQNDPQYQSWLDCINGFDSDADPNLYSISYLGGRYEMRSCQPECTYYLFKYYPYYGCTYLWELDDFEDCEDQFEEGFNVLGRCGRRRHRYYWGIYVDCGDVSDEVTGTGCMFAVIADEIEEVDPDTGETIEADDQLAVIMIDDDGTVAYTNCGNAGDSVTTTSIDESQFPNGLRTCQDGILGGDGGTIFFSTNDIDGNNGEFTLVDGVTWTVTVDDANGDFSNTDGGGGTYTFDTGN
jgi:predicted small metal-binding protein